MTIFRSSFYLFFAITLIFITSCNKVENKNESKQNLQEQAHKANVFVINSVGQPVNGKAVDFTFDKNGTKQSFSDLTKNKIVLLNFWATWCPPCRRELPNIVEISKELKAQDVEVIGVSLDSEGNPSETVKNFTEKNNIPYLNLIGNPEIADAYGGISGIPATFIIDKSGNIISRFEGSQSKQTFVDALNQVIKK